jgi:RimJ/RimL family protein N-acetyltransferase
MLGGRPEARFEAFARAYAGCGENAILSYRRSYARMYEQLCCENYNTDDEYGAMYKSNPETIVGKYLWLEGLDAKRHLEKAFAATSGDMYYHKKTYNPSEVWGFLEDGPFDSPESMRKSFVFQHKENQAGFCIVQAITQRVLGVIMLSKDDPENLSIQLDAPILAPSNWDGKEELEACFLLMDRLFANGYRRIQFSVDAKDGQASKLVDRLGFTFEGCLLKDQIIKGASRDSNVYGMLNSDWDKGARKALVRKLYGASTAQADEVYNKKEEELDEQQRVLAERKALEKQGTDKKNA